MDVPPEIETAKQQRKDKKNETSALPPVALFRTLNVYQIPSKIFIFDMILTKSSFEKHALLPGTESSKKKTCKQFTYKPQ